MSRKSKHEELRARAFGSEMDNEAEASKDIVGWREIFQSEVVTEVRRVRVTLKESASLVVLDGCQLEGSEGRGKWFNVVSRRNWRRARLSPLCPVDTRMDRSNKYGREPLKTVENNAWILRISANYVNQATQPEKQTACQSSSSQIHRY
jgi:hypothetical protein